MLLYADYNFSFFTAHRVGKLRNELIMNKIQLLNN